MQKDEKVIYCFHYQANIIAITSLGGSSFWLKTKETFQLSLMSKSLGENILLEV